MPVASEEEVVRREGHEALSGGGRKMLPETLAVIRDQDHEEIIGDAALFEHLQEDAQVFVCEADLLIVEGALAVDLGEGL